MKWLELRIGGMHCNGCASTIEALLAHEPGVKATSVSFDTRKGRILKKCSRVPTIPGPTRSTADRMASISALGARDGGGPGGIFRLDHYSFDVLGRWEVDRGPQYLAYDFWRHLGYDTMVTSEWGTPNMVGAGLFPNALFNSEYGRVGGESILFGFGVYRLIRFCHPAWVAMRGWLSRLNGMVSFKMASAHGAGLMLVPVLLGCSGGDHSGARTPRRKWTRGVRRSFLRPLLVAPFSRA